MIGQRESGRGNSYPFNLDKVVPPDHLVCEIDAVIDLNWVHRNASRLGWLAARDFRSMRG
jgi:hypothetical protein